MATWIKVNGVWRNVRNIWKNVNGVWQDKVIPKANIAGDWKFFKKYILHQDSFNRANDSTSLGTTDTGEIWQAYGTNNIWGIENNQAYPVSAKFDYPIYLNTGISDNIKFQLKIATVDTGEQHQIMWRIKDSFNYFCLQGNIIYNVVNDDWNVIVGKIYPKLVDGDVFTVEIHNNRHLIKVNGFERVEFFNNTHIDGDKFGFGANSSVSAYNTRYDDLLIENFPPPETIVPDVPSTNITEDFLDDSYNFTFTQHDIYPWTRLNSASPDGNLGHIISSNQGIHNSTSYIIFDILVPSGTERSWIEVDYAVDSEINYDYLYIYINGIEKTKISGMNQIGTFMTDVVAGSHKLKISYFKDPGAEDGTDSAYISGLRLFHSDNKVIPYAGYAQDQSTTILGETVDYYQVKTVTNGTGLLFATNLTPNQNYTANVTVELETGTTTQLRLGIWNATKQNYVEIGIDYSSETIGVQQVLTGTFNSGAIQKTDEIVLGIYHSWDGINNENITFKVYKNGLTLLSTT